MRRILLALLAIAPSLALAQTQTTYTGTVKDLTGTTVTSGRITFSTQLSGVLNIAGTGAFVSTTVSCLINASGNPVSSTDGTSPCVVTNNTALSPTGTHYNICIQPYYATPGSCLNAYAIGGTVDLSTLIPTPATQPSFGQGVPGPPGPTGPAGSGLVDMTAPGPIGGVTPSTAVFTALTAKNIANNYQSISTFGDSITQGTGATTFMTPGVTGQQTCWQGNSDYALACYSSGPTAYAYKLLADFGNSGNNYGRGGDMSTDMSWHVATWAHPTLTGNPAITAMIGTNDNSLCGTNVNCQDTTIKAELFSAAQATIPDSLKTFASACTASAGWTADANLPGAMYTTTNGATLTCTSSSSSTETYVAYVKCDNTSNGTGTLAVNGTTGTQESILSFYGLASSSIFWANGTSVASGSGLFSHCSLALARNTGVIGTNTTLFTSTGTGRAEIFWVGGPYKAGATDSAPPLYVIGGVPYENANAGQPGVGQYNTIAHNAYTTMLSDGNNVRWADVQALMNSSTDFTGGGGNGPSGQPWAASWLNPLHPGDSGMNHIYQAFRAQLNPVVLPSQTLSLWAGATGSISSSGSLSGRYGADGGLGGAQVASVLGFTNTANLSLVGTNYATPGSHTVTFGQWGSGFASGLPGVTGLIDATKTFFAWNTTSNGDFCVLTAVSYGSPNANGCAGATLFVQGGLLGNQYRMGMNTATPGVYNGLGAAGSEAILQIDGQAQAVSPALVLQSNNAAANPYLKLINKQATSGKRDWSIVHRTSPLQFAITQCSDDETSCSDAVTITDSTKSVAIPFGLTASAVTVTGCAGGTFVKGDGTGCGTAAGGGTVTTVSTGNLSPLFTAAIANPASTPALSFTLSSAAAHTVFGNPTGGSTAPVYTANPVLASILATIYYTNAEFSNGTCTTAKTIDPANGNKQKVTLTNGSTCALTFTQPGSGTATVQLKVIQSAVSTFNGAISGCQWPGGTVPTITQTTGAIDMISIYLDGTNAYCQIAQAFS